MRVWRISKWDDAFFEKLVRFRNEIHASLPTSFPETPEDYKKYFSPDSPFAADYEWTAVLLLEDDQIKAKAIICSRKESTTGNLGFIDWVNDKKVATVLIAAVEDICRERKISLIKTPVDLNFYVKYRIRLPGGGKPFWGEPIYPDYYHDLFKSCGFEVIGEWDSYRLFKIQGIIDYFKKRKQLSKKREGSHAHTMDPKLRTTIRCVNIADWDNELRIIHSLFNQAYQNMPEWESVTFDQFKLIYDDFKYIINPLYAYIVELQGKPVGFSINFVDPLPVLSKVKGKNLSLLSKALVLAKLRLNTSTFIIAHVGKIPGPNGEEIKGVQIQASRRIQFAGALMRKILVTFQMKGSPSRRSFEESSQESYAQYVLYGKKL